jgi:hypothetical protein
MHSKTNVHVLIFLAEDPLMVYGTRYHWKKRSSLVHMYRCVSYRSSSVTDKSVPYRSSSVAEKGVPYRSSSVTDKSVPDRSSSVADKSVSYRSSVTDKSVSFRSSTVADKKQLCKLKLK